MALSNFFNQVREAAQSGGGGYTAPAQAPAPTPYAPAPAPAAAPVAAPAAASGNPSLAQLMGTDWENVFHMNNATYKPTNFDFNGKSYSLERLGQDQGGQDMGYIAYDPNDRYGSGATYFDNSGNFSNHQAWREASNNMLVPALAAAGMMFGLPGVGGFGGEAGAGALSGMDLAADTAGWWGGTGGAAAGAGGLIAPTVPLESVGAISSGAVAPVVAETAAAGGLGSVAAGAAGGGSLTGLPWLDKIITGVGTSAAVGAITGQGGAGGGGGLNLGGLGGLLGGAIDYSNQNRMADKLFDYVNKSNADIDKLYAPGSPEYKTLWDQMSAKDAAAGRNSQYGTRTVDFMGKTAADKARLKVELAKGLSGMFEKGAGTQASSAAGLSGALGNLLGGSGGNGTLNAILSGLGNGASSLTQNLSSYLNGTYGYNDWQSGLSTGYLNNGDQIYG